MYYIVAEVIADPFTGEVLAEVGEHIENADKDKFEWVALELGYVTTHDFLCRRCWQFG